MSITRVGSTQKFSAGWDGIFAGARGKKAAKKSAKKAAKKPAEKKPAAKKAASKPAVGKKAAKQSAPPAPDRPKKKRATKRPAIGENQGPGDDVTKKVAAKRTGKTRTKRSAPVLQQMELF